MVQPFSSLAVRKSPSLTVTVPLLLDPDPKGLLPALGLKGASRNEVLPCPYPKLSLKELVFQKL